MNTISHKFFNSNRLISLLMTVIMLFAIFPSFATSASTAKDTNEAPAEKGIWITEIYQNDISRTPAYPNSGGSDLMEFVEIVNTSEQDIAFNDLYDLRYEYTPVLTNGRYTNKVLTVTDGNGNNNITIHAGEVVVIWSYRPDIAEANRAAEAEFRAVMDVPDDVQVWKCSGQNGFAENDRGFLVTPKGNNNEILSWYHYNYTTDAVTSDALGVHLQIPDYGYEMIALEIKKPPSAGVVYNDQLGGQMVILPPEELSPNGLYITEIFPNDVDRNVTFGSGSNDIMECLELTNTTDHDIDFNNEYELYYVIKKDGGNGSNEKLQILYKPETQDTDCMIPAGSTAVLWCDRESYLVPGSVPRWPSEAEFRTAHKIPADVPVYVFRNQNGLGNTDRGFSLRKKAEGGKTELVSYYFWDGVKDLKDNRSVELRISPEGPKMSIYRAQAATTLGVCDPNQVTYPANDDSFPMLELLDDRTSINQGEFMRIPYFYEGTRMMPVNAIELYYKTPGMSSFVCIKTTSFAIYNKWYTFIPSDVLLHADYVDYYVKARNAYRFSKTDIRRIAVNKINDASGLRVSLNGETADNTQTVSGNVNITAKDFTGSAEPVTMTLDGNPLTTHASLEKCAFYTFSYTGVDAYFKNALACGNKIIKLLAACSEIPNDSSMAIRVDSSNFTYNSDGSTTIGLDIWSGTHGSTWESYTDANNDDFTITNIALSLPDGTVYRPTSLKGETYGTTDSIDLDPDAVIKMGDSAGCTIFAKAVFNIPADKIDAIAATVDTTTLSDDEHMLVVTSGETSETIIFTVDNSEPEPEPEPEKEHIPTDMGITVDASVYPANAVIEADDKADKVTVYEANSLININAYEGTGDSTASAAEKTDNSTTLADNGEFPYQVYEITVDENETGNPMRFDVTADTDYDRNIQLYVLNTADNTWEILEAYRNGNVVTAIFPLDNRISDGKTEVLVQARGRESTPYTSENTNKTQKNTYDWDGTGIPEQYDFSFAWITDTQYYAEQYFNNYGAMIDWIVNNKTNLNIKYLMHTGDIVDEFNEEYQFINSSNQLKKLEDAGLPYGLLAGNHDVGHGNEIYDWYYKYFGADRYKDNPFYGGSYKNNLNHYDLITIDGVEMIFVYMSWDLYLPEIEWANSILEKYADRKAVICMHPGINANAAQDYESNLMIEHVYKKNKNVFAVLNGHYHGSSLNFIGFDDDGDGTRERVVYQICTDYQSAPEGGSGYVKMLYFDLANSKIYINSYSPILNDYNYYDTPKLDSYGIGTVEKDIDIAELSVNFNRDEVRTLTVTDVKTAILTDTKVGEAGVDVVTNVQLSTQTGTTMTVYAKATDVDGNVTAYSDTVTFTAEDSTVEPIPVTGIQLNAGKISLAVGSKITFLTAIAPSNATNQTVIWSSSDSSVAAVDSSGTIETMKAGTATITVTTEDGSFTDICKVTVTNPTEDAIPVTGISLDKSNLSLTVGETSRLKAAITPDNATNQMFTWLSGNNDTVMVDSKGKIIAIKTGTVTVTATTQDGAFTADCVVTVTDKATETVPASNLNLSAAAKTLVYGSTYQLNATTVPANADGKVVFDSSDNKVAMVDSTGKVAAKGIGTAKITAKIGTISKTCTITVTKKQLDKPKGLKLTAKKASWKKVDNNNGYKLKIQQGKKTIKTISIKKGKASYTIKKGLLKKNKKYRFSLVAIGNGNYRDSKVAKSKTVTLQTPITLNSRSRTSKP